MKLTHNKVGTGGEPRRNAAEERQSNPRKRNKLSKFFMETLPNTVKKHARVLALVTGMTVTAVACTGNQNHTGNPDSSTDAPADTTDADTDTSTPGACPGSYDELEGAVNPLMRKTESMPLYFNGPEGESVSGTAEITVGADAEDLVILGDCTGLADTSAAFGGSEATITPSFRIDVIDAYGQFTSLSAESCSPSGESPPVSMFSEGEIVVGNVTLIPAQLSSLPGGAEVGLVNPIDLKVVNAMGGAELANPIVLTAVTTVMVASDPSMLTMAAKPLSSDGTELTTSEVHATTDPLQSNKLKIFKTDSMLPDIGRWKLEGTPGDEGSVQLCLRPCSDENPYAVVEEAVELTGLDITGAVSDSCGELFASFDVVSINAQFNTERHTLGVEPLHLAADYELATELNYGEGLDALSEGSPKAYVYVRRAIATDLDTGDRVMMDVDVTVTMQSREENPNTGEKDVKQFEFTIHVSVPSRADYGTVCGCEPSLPG